MKTFRLPLKFSAVILLALGTFTGCESTDNGSTHTSATVYYGTGYSDPWYYGQYDYDRDDVVTPPSPGQEPHPSHPIAQPPAVSPRPPMASPRPMPSIPSAPRGGGRR